MELARSEYVERRELPVGSFALVAADNALATCLDRHPAAGSAERIGAGVDGIGQDVVDGVVDEAASTRCCGRSATV